MLSERAAGGEGGDPSTVSGPRGRGARWLTEHAAHPGAATREPTRSPRSRQCEYSSQGDHPQNWRATFQGPAGALYVFNTDGILALSAHVAYVPAGVFILHYETMLTYHISCFLISRSFNRSLHSGAADVSPAPLLHFGFLKGARVRKLEYRSGEVDRLHTPKACDIVLCDAESRHFSNAAYSIDN